MTRVAGMIDLLRGGQGMFGIALGGVWRDIEGSLFELPTERAEASSLREATGKFRRSRTRRISTPTAPVAPTTAMF